MSNDAIIKILMENRWLFVNNDFFITIFRFIGWILVKGLTMLANACASVYDIAFKFVDFSQYAPVRDFIDSWKPVFIALICLSLFIMGVILIMYYEKRPKFVINLCLAVLVVSSTTYIFGMLNNVVVAGKDAIVGNNSSQPVYDVIKDNIYDLVYIDAQIGLSNLNGSRGDYPTYSTFDQENMDMINTGEVINYQTNKMTTSESKDILKQRLYYVYGTGPGLEEVYNGFGWNTTDSDDWFNGFYYRYKVDWVPLYMSLISLCLVYFLMGYKVFRLLFELGVYQIVAVIQSANLSGSQKTLKVLDAIKNSYVVILFTCVLIKFYSLGAQYINSTITNNGLIRGIFLIFLALAVVDGPNLIQQLYGIDAGLSSGFGKLMGGYYAMRAAGHTVAGAAKGIKGGIGGLAHALNEKNDNKVGGDKSNLNGLNDRGQLGGSGGTMQSEGANSGLSGGNTTPAEEQAANNGSPVPEADHAATGTPENQYYAAGGNSENNTAGDTNLRQSETVQVQQGGSQVKNQESLYHSQSSGDTKSARNSSQDASAKTGTAQPGENNLQGADPSKGRGQGNQLETSGARGADISDHPLAGRDAYGQPQNSPMEEMNRMNPSGEANGSSGIEKAEPQSFGGTVFQNPETRNPDNIENKKGEGGISNTVKGSSWAVKEYQNEKSRASNLSGRPQDQKGGRKK